MSARKVYHHHDRIEMRVAGTRFAKWHGRSRWYEHISYGSWRAANYWGNDWTDAALDEIAANRTIANKAGDQ